MTYSKQSLVALVAFFVFHITHAQITTNEVTIENTTKTAITGNLEVTGSLGIGTSNPRARLHVFNGNNSYGAILANSSETAFSLYTKSLGREPDTETFRLGLKYNDDERNGFISFFRGNSFDGGFLGISTNAAERVRISRDGNVGIGTETSTEKLEVNGNIQLGNNQFLKGKRPGGGASNLIGYLGTGNNILSISQFSSAPSEVRIYTPTDANQGVTIYSDRELVFFRNDGNVGIGTSTPDEKLHVAGKIRATGQEGWSDFVFYQDYELPSLEDVEQHIEENGHLKDIPSEAEVLEEGIDLTEMDSKLLQKIEELPLYVIDLNKRVNELESENKALKADLKN